MINFALKPLNINLFLMKYENNHTYSLEIPSKI